MWSYAPQPALKASLFWAASSASPQSVEKLALTASSRSNTGDWPGEPQHRKVAQRYLRLAVRLDHFQELQPLFITPLKIIWDIDGAERDYAAWDRVH